MSARPGQIALLYLAKPPWQRSRIGVDTAEKDLRELIAERDELRTAVIVLRDRLYATNAVVAAIAMDEPDIEREGSEDCVTRNHGVIRVTDPLDPTDRSAPDWVEAATARRMALAKPLAIPPAEIPTEQPASDPETRDVAETEGGRS